MGLLENLPNPKRDRSSATGRAGWYPYYAGYSTSFAAAVLDRFATNPNTTILDPWNGSGTTTAVTAGKGHKGYGFDLNPVMSIVARARLLNKRDRPSLLPLAAFIVNSTSIENVLGKSDPLCLWFHPNSAAAIRGIELGIQKCLIGNDQWKPMEEHVRTSAFSDLLAFFYVALFRTVRSLLSRFQSSNPTWMKTAKDVSNSIRPSKKEIKNHFLAQIKSMESAIEMDLLEKDAKVTISVSPSQMVPLSSNSVDLILSSPPYCTRIDYASATKPELALMGLNSTEGFKALRKDLLGTPTVPKDTISVQSGWGETCKQFLEAVRAHKSKASSGYYYKGHCQYFEGIYNSLSELTRCLKPSGRMCLIIQDSFYKDIHNDLPLIFCEMSQQLGLKTEDRSDFTFSKGMGQINSMSRRYRNSSTATESIILLTKLATT